LGLLFAKALNMLELSRFSAGGLGADSLLEGLVAAAAAGVGFVFSFPLPKKSLAVDDCRALVSCLIDVAEGLGASFVGWAFAGIAAAAGAGTGRLPVRRLTFLLIIVPYLGANSRGSSVAQSSWICRVTSDIT
jgi:hypothetical protein